MGLTPEQEAIRELEVDLTLTRKNVAGTRIVDGIPFEKANTPVPFRGAIQPITGKLIRHLPEGQDARDTRMIWTIDLNIGLKIDDEITDGIETVIVQDPQFWREGGFFMATALRRKGSIQ